jgi:hypothetical protein
VKDVVVLVEVMTCFLGARHRNALLTGHVPHTLLVVAEHSVDSYWLAPHRDLQAWQVTAPSLAEKVSAAQSWHADIPDTLLYVPASQSVHSKDPASKE